MNSSEKILKSNRIEANLFASVILFFISGLSLVAFFYSRVSYLYSFYKAPWWVWLLILLDNIHRICLFITIRKKKGVGSSFPVFIVTNLFIAGIFASLIFHQIFWPLFVLAIVYTIRYNNAKFTLIFGLIISFFIPIISILLVPYGFITDYINLDFISFAEDTTLQVKKGYSELYKAVKETGNFDMSLVYMEALYESMSHFMGMLVFSILISLIAKHNHKVIEDEISKDSDEKKQLEEYNKIIANAGYGIWYITMEDNCKPKMKANHKMLEVLGISNEELSEEEIYEHWYSRIYEEEIPSVTNSVKLMMRGKLSENTYRWNHPKFGMIYVRCGGRCYVSEKNKKVLCGYHSDVTDIVLADQKHHEELEAAKLAAEKANKIKTEFLFNMSHDIRTPMNAIVGYTELVKSHLDDKEAAESYLKKIQYSNDFLLSLINNVLEMARIDSGKMEIDEEYWNYTIFNDTLVSVFDAQMKEKSLKFKRCINVEHQDVMFDATKVREIFLNILSNALKYTPAGGIISMRVEELASNRPGYVLYRTTITDSGIGMSKDFIPHIFEEFTREHTSTESRVIGTGLGMPIVKKLVDFLGGDIEVRSELGKGSTFIVTLSHRIALQQDIHRVNAAPEDLNYDMLKGKRILLAEDNELNAEIAVTILSEAGLSMDVACDGIECINKMNRSNPGYYDCILMDIQMPNMDGYKTTQVIRQMADPLKKNIPIIAMTANAFEEDKRNAVESGMNGHIAKPINLNELMHVLSDNLD